MAKCCKARKWKRRYKAAVSARGVDQAKAFEERSNLLGQLRAVDHILLERELPGLTLEEWSAQARELIQDLVATRLQRKTAGYSKRDLEQEIYRATRS